MIVLALASTIAAAVFALTILFLAHGRRDDDRGGARAEMVRYFGMSALAALLCGAMNVLEAAGAGTAAAAGGNALNVMAVGLFWAGARRLNLRRTVGATGVVAVGIFFLGLTFVVSLEDATVLKTAGLAVFALLAAVECANRPLGDLRGTRILTWTLSLFAAYNVVRFAVVVAVGTAPLVEPGLLSAEATAVVSTVSIALVTVGAIRLGRQLDDRPSPGTRAHDRGALRREAARLIAAHGRARVTVVHVTELELIRTAHSTARGREMLKATVGAVGDALPDGAAGLPVRDTVFAVSSPRADTDETEDAVRRALTRRVGLLGYDDVPDLSFQYSLVSTVDGLSALMKRRRPRLRSGSL